MSHYNRSYKGLSQDAADDAAMKDIQFYLGDMFDKVEHIIKNAIASGEIKTVEHVAFSLSFAGIEGYPVEAWARKLGIK